MRTLAALLLAVYSVSAYFITNPTATEGWTTTGANKLSWNRVETDPLTFAVVLENKDLDSDYFEILDCNVDGTALSYYPNEPFGGWPAGTVFRVDIVQDCEYPHNLLAQSPQFEITDTDSKGL